MAALAGFVTFPALMQPVQTSIRFVVLPTTERTRWMFGFQRRLVRLWEWLRDLPNQGFLPHMSQTDAITHTLVIWSVIWSVVWTGQGTVEAYGHLPWVSNPRAP